MITGERVSTSEGGWGPTFQRHVAAYRLCAPLLPDGRVLDLGCGTGHSYRELAPRETVGVDLEASALAGQERETRVADMRSLPFGAAEFDGVLSVQSIEHVPDPERVLTEVRRVLVAGGRAVFVTPNRLTFARPEEIIDPYHYVEYDPTQLRALCASAFSRVEILGLHGSARYGRLVADERRALDRVLSLDPLRLRRLIPRARRQRLYDRRLSASRRVPATGADAIGPEDFRLESHTPELALDVVAVCDLG
ncbi:MAG: class I SAM-dependent methyltransferase [Actinomycetota bacterium]|nr:class I SAM-dependent methyltransferase [Actinomycetota bacterium]